MRARIRSIVFLPLVLGILGTGYGMLLAADDGNKDDTAQKLIGTWKLLTAKYGDDVVDVERLGVTLKHITPTSFMLLSYDPQTKVISRTSGGSYTLQGDRYEETPRYGLGEDSALTRDKVQSFTVKIDGDKWHHVGTLSNGVKIDEVWERCKKE
jgi:hypothetical protein